MLYFFKEIFSSQKVRNSIAKQKPTTYLWRLIQSRAFSLDKAARGSFPSWLSLKSNDLKEDATFLKSIYIVSKFFFFQRANNVSSFLSYIFPKIVFLCKFPWSKVRTIIEIQHNSCYVELPSYLLMYNVSQMWWILYT